MRGAGVHSRPKAPTQTRARITDEYPSRTLPFTTAAMAQTANNAAATAHRLAGRCKCPASHTPAPNTTAANANGAWAFDFGVADFAGCIKRLESWYARRLEMGITIMQTNWDW